MSYGPWAIEDDPRLVDNGGSSGALLEEGDEAGCDRHYPNKVLGCRACEESDE